MDQHKLDSTGQYAWILQASGDLEERRRIQKMVFPDGIRYNREKDIYRTTRVNSLFSLIPQLVGGIEETKNGTCSDKLNLSRLVPGTGQLSNFLLAEDIGLCLDA